MFELKNTEYETQMIGTFVDVLEFGERWSKFSTFQKSVLKACSYVGTLDDFALSLGYSAPMATMYRKQLIELEKGNLIHIVDFDKDYFERNKEIFDYYDFGQTAYKHRKNTKMIFIPNTCDVINRILKLSPDKLPQHDNIGPMRRTSNDNRANANKRRKENRKK